MNQCDGCMAGFPLNEKWHPVTGKIISFTSFKCTEVFSCEKVKYMNEKIKSVNCIFLGKDDEWALVKNEWIKCSEQLPEAYDKVLAQFQLCDAPIKHIFIAYLDKAQEWNLYQLYNSFPVDKSKLIPLYWMPLPQLPEED